MLGLDPEGPIPLELVRDLPVGHAVHMFRTHGSPTPISGDPHFMREL